MSYLGNVPGLTNYTVAVEKFTVYFPVPLSVIELTLPEPRIATVPVPLKLTHALHPYAVATEP